jgi:hypothetical protein
MGAVEPPALRTGLIARAAGMLFRPGRTWDAADGEPASVVALLRDYVAPLALIPALCGLVGQLTFGAGMAGIGIRPSPRSAIAGAATDYLLTLVSVYLLALAIHGLAPAFGARRHIVQATKVAAYSGTALWLSGIFALYPALGWLAGILAGLYSLYALSMGLARLMHAPADRELAYFTTVLITTLALMALVALASRGVRDLVGGPLSVIGGRLSPDM